MLTFTNKIYWQHKLHLVNIQHLNMIESAFPHCTLQVALSMAQNRKQSFTKLMVFVGIARINSVRVHASLYYQVIEWP